MTSDYQHTLVNSINNTSDSVPESAQLSAHDGLDKKRPSTKLTGPPRKRTTRACDQCNHLRTKCDGQNPCAHCTGMSSPPRS